MVIFLKNLSKIGINHAYKSYSAYKLPQNQLLAPLFTSLSHHRCARCYPVVLHMSQGRINSLVLGDKLIQPLMTGILIMGPYKPLRTWVVEFPIPYYMEMSWELIDPTRSHAHILIKTWQLDLIKLAGAVFFNMAPMFFCAFGLPSWISRSHF